MAEGKSFSGRERNSFFLNTGSGKFADISGLSGFDYLDDARSICLGDWDFDGALDFWAYNRNSPRLRLMRNTSSSAAGSESRHWVALRLKGVTCNRDAIGARVEVTTPSGTQFRTLRAGEGFLSQSSKWLHLGLGNDSGIEKVTVRWPGSPEPETFTAVTSNTFQILEQGTATATQWMPPSGSPPLDPFDQESSPVDETARIVLAARPPLPPLEILDGIANTGKPLLINVWATWCGPCLEELSAMIARASEFKQKGLDIVLLNADDPTDSDRPNKVAKTLGKLNSSFENRIADERTVSILDAFQRALTQRQRPLPLPASFLVDSEGRVAVIYKGKAEVDTVLRDLEMLESGPDAWREQAAPFAGQWYQHPPQPNPLRIAMKFLDLGEAKLSATYLERFLATYADTMEPRSALADVYFALGRAHSTDGQDSAAAGAYQSAIKADLNYRKAYVELGHMLLKRNSFDAADRLLSRAVQLDRSDADTVVLEAMARLGMQKFEDVEKLCRFALTLQPDHLTARYNLAFALQQMKRHREAADTYAGVLKLANGQIMAANNLAWILATSPDDSLRNGREAVRIIQQLCDSPAGETQPIFWMTLGAAHAEAGDFVNATGAAQRALQLCSSTGIPKGSTLPATLQEQLLRYQQSKPVRD
ncbi:MAG: ASPIC/UnbV domain-containing protein [Verrucomicrobiae bacterium]|nr:ASPIC/UnbV domain-containing protein [Verrucomicrobiae bacterium]